MISHHGTVGQLCLCGQDSGMKELPAGLNPVLRNRTVNSTALSVEIQRTLVENFMSSTEG
jgi:hypothetical protein